MGTNDQSERQALRFDEFVANNRIVVAPAARFEGFTVTVVLPPDWEPFGAAPFDSTPGTRVWTWVADPLIKQFGANVVLSMSRMEASIDPAEVFAMLCEWQVNIVEGSRERHRGFRPATDGPGIVGSLIMEIPSEFGCIGSESVSRIVPGGSQTLIAQLTITALCDSPVGRGDIRLIVAPADAAGTGPGVYLGGTPIVYQGDAPVSPIREGH